MIVVDKLLLLPWLVCFTGLAKSQQVLRQQPPSLQPTVPPRNQPSGRQLQSTRPPLAINNQDGNKEPADSTPDSPKRSHVSMCICNRQSGVCDVGCCCDPDCSYDDLEAFGECLDFEDKKTQSHCINANKLAFFQTTSFIDYSGSNYLCIDSPDSTSRNYAVDLQTLDDPALFIKTARQYKNVIALSDEPVLIPKSFYRLGDPLLSCRAFSESSPRLPDEKCALGRITLPVNSLLGGNCNDGEPIRFMKHTKATCWRKSNETDLNLLCSASRNKAVSYFDRIFVVKSPADFHVMSLRLNYSYGADVYPNRVEIADLFDLIHLAGEANVTKAIMDGFTVPVTAECFDQGRGLTECSSPEVENGYCNNVATSVAYHIAYFEGTVSSVRVSIQLENVAVDQLDLMSQSFSVAFRPEDKASFAVAATDYAMGSPVPAGKLTEEASVDSEVSVRKIELLQKGLTVPAAPSDGQCSLSAPRVPVKFGVDSQTGCSIPLVGSCDDIQKSIYSLAFGNGADRPTHVAMFGSADTDYFEMWLPIVNDTAPSVLLKPIGSPRNGTCQNLRTKVALHMLYSRTGPPSTPVIQLVGAAYDFGAQRNYTMPCLGGAAACSIFVSFQVHFQDITEKTFPSEEKQYYSRTDFFYPFFMNAPLSHAVRLAPADVVFVISLVFLQWPMRN